MLKWIGKALGATAPERGGEQPTGFLARLANCLEGVDVVPGRDFRPNVVTDNGGRAGLGKAIIAFVADGTSPAVLSELGQRTQVAAFLGIAHAYQQQKSKGLQSLYDALAPSDALHLVRWGQVLAASANRHARSLSLAMPDGSQWLELLLLHITGESSRDAARTRASASSLTMDIVEAALHSAGLPASALVVSAFSSPLQRYRSRAVLLGVATLAGYAKAVERNADLIRPHLLDRDIDHRVHVLDMLARLDDVTVPFFSAELVALACASSRQVRTPAAVLVARCGLAALAPLKAMVASGKPDERAQALRLVMELSRTGGDNALGQYARETAAADKAPSVQVLVAEWNGAVAAAETEVAYQYDMPVIEWAALTPAVSSAVEAMWRGIHAEVSQLNASRTARHAMDAAQGQTHKLYLLEQLDPAELNLLKESLRDPGPPSDRFRSSWSWRNTVFQGQINALAKREGMTPSALMKVLCFFNVGPNDSGRLGQSIQPFNSMHATQQQPSLLHLAAMLQQMGLPTEGLLLDFCNGWNALGTGWSGAALWPYFAHHRDALVAMLLSPGTAEYGTTRAPLFRAVAVLPTPPSQVVNALFDLALGSAKAERPAAQQALASHPGKEARIIAALSDGRAEIRTAAAQWLGSLRHDPAIGPLDAAVASEKHDVAKGAMLDALQALGRPVECYLNRDTLLSEASRLLAKGAPRDISWFPFDAMPGVTWADSGEAVHHDILRWMVVQAMRQKNVEPNAVLRKYCAMFEPKGRERLGQFVLDTWMAEDIHPIDADEAMKMARAESTQLFNSMQQHPTWYKESPHLGKSVEQLLAERLPGFLKHPRGSAIASKGVLAVAAACAGGGAAQPVAQYLKEYYGKRASQGRALITMLAWIEHPSATQLMLSVGSRFRTKGFQEEATRQAQALAERKNWTMAELADRTVPTGGFDESGVLELPYGERMFIARLQPGFKISLENPDGKKITSLPQPRADDDQDLAKESKKSFSAARKELKTVVDMQSGSLYEAMCTEREWSYDDFDLYFHRHPIVRHLVQRLVWMEVDGDGSVKRTFRPLDDGTLTNAHDEPMELRPEARVRMAHDAFIDAVDSGLWQRHLADYEVQPLFAQLGRTQYTKPAGGNDATEVTEFTGHLMESFQLRGLALKRGYTRGRAEDGGWFMTYDKRFTTLGITAYVQFTGSPLPEENRKVALVSLWFAKEGVSSWQRPQVPLANVPRVLLTECYNDLRLLAAAGQGFDKDWEKICSM